MKTFTAARPQRGLAVLAVTALLCFAAILVLAQTNRSISTADRSSANRYRAAQAFEAAEAGVDWAIGHLNDDTPLGPDCSPSSAAGTLSFRDTYVPYDADLRRPMPATWNDTGTPRPLQAACIRGATGWDCSCPVGGVPSLPTPVGLAAAPAFNVTFAADAGAGVVRIVATGCTDAATDCSASTDRNQEAAARIEVMVALLPGLRAEPAAALTTRGNIDAGGAALGAHNGDAASGGLAVQAGGRVTASAIRLTAPPGSPLDRSIVATDLDLAGLSSDRFFARWFGMTRDAWQRQPAVTWLSCSVGNCASALTAAVARGSRLIAVEDDLTLSGSLTLGEPDRPVIIVVAGSARLSGSIVLHGLLHAASIDWTGVGSGASVIGAAISAGDYSGTADVDFIRDAATLARLRHGTGSFVRVAGSWKDF